MATTVLVTGASGMNGAELVRQLSAMGQSVRALVRSRARAEGLDLPGVEVVEGDFGDPASLDRALDGIEKAFLLPPLTRDTVDLQESFIGASKRAGVRHLVRLSAMGAARGVQVSLLRKHYEAAQILAGSEVPHTELQPNGFMQNLLGMADMIKQAGTIYQPAGDARVSHIDVRDIARAAARVLTEDGHDGKTYVLTGPAAITYDEIAADLSAATGRPVAYVSVSPEQFLAGAVQSGMPEWLATGIGELFAYYRDGHGALVTDDVARLTGQPATSFAQFARDHAAAFSS